MQIVPRKAGAHAIRPLTEMTGRRFSSQICISAEQLHKTVMLQHMDGFQCPIMPREMEVAIHIAAVFPIRRKPPHTLVDCTFLDPQAGISPQLQIKWIVRTCNLVGAIPECDFDNMQRNIRTSFHMKTKVMKGFASTLPAVRIRIHRNNMQLLALGILDKLTMNIRMLKDQNHLLVLHIVVSVKVITSSRPSTPRLSLTTDNPHASSPHTANTWAVHCRHSSLDSSFARVHTA